MGVFMGNDLDDNFESQFFCRLNQWAFTQAGASWDNPYNMRFVDYELSDGLSENFDNHIRSRRIRKYGKTLNSLNNSMQAWGWKDPRNTFTLSIWQRIFPDAKIIHIYRNPVDVAASLQKRERYFRDLRDSKTRTGLRKRFHERFLTKKRLYSQSVRVFHLDEGIKLWQEYTRQALKADKHAVHLSYEDLLENPEKELEQLCNFLELAANTETIAKAVEGINPERKFAFLNSENLTKKYKEIQNTPLLETLNYGQIV
jgi:hypothetical protein